MNLTLLVIDDDVVDRQAVVRALRQVHPDAIVVEAEEPLAAYRSLARGGIDCVLLDYYLPGGDGLDVVARLQAEWPDVPVIALTGRGDQQVAVAMMKAGARDYLDKRGLTPELLDQSIRHSLSMAAAERERRALLAREQEARREAQLANHAKDEFLATLSHELRTPLNAILGWARIMKAGGLDPPRVVRAIEAIERNALVQTKLIEDLLDISRVITGKLQLDPSPLTLTTIAEAVMESMQPAAAARGVALEYATTGPEHPVVGDAARLQQVMTNLLSNAIKFTPEGGCVRLVLEFGPHEVQIAVTDTGAGIDREFLPYVFDRFRQAESAATRRHGGLGLGLSIVRHLAEIHGGRVSATSDGPGTGATFTVTLPVAAGAQVALADPVETPASSIEGTRVLVVDDDEDARVLLRTVLERHGAIVRDAGTAADALAQATAERPDVVLSDIAMPDRDGYALVRQLRELYPHGAFGALAITAFASVGDRQRALAAGYDAHMPKPLDPAVLIAMVSTLRPHRSSATVAWSHPDAAPEARERRDRPRVIES